MTSYDEALRVINSIKIAAESEKIPILESLNRVACSDVFSKLDFPVEDNSAMDGYALKSSLTLDIPPAGLTLEIGEDTIYAGEIYKKEVDFINKAVKIMTGGYIPSGLDAVIPFEDATVIDRRLIMNSPIKINKNVRKKGEDIQKGDKILNKNSVLNPGKIALLISCNIKNINVYKKLPASVISSGNEILQANQKYRYGKIFNSNGVLAELFLLSNGCSVIKNVICKDNLNAIKNEIESALKSSKIIITSAGASYGEKDFTEKALIDLGLRIKFRQVAIKPAKPFSFGLIDKIPIFMVPGNPVAFFTCLIVFIKPFINSYYGISSVDKIIKSRSKFKYTKNHKRREFIPAYTFNENGCYFTDIYKKSGPAMISVLGRANSVLDIPEDKFEINPDDYLDVHFI